MLDSNVLRDVKSDGENFVYREVRVRDGPQIAIVLKQMVNQFDLIIVGRRSGVDWQHTQGLEEWSEFPKLGIIGDLLASSDFNGQASILVVQQQTKLN
ncbi:cation/H+ exchanger 4 [Euphorbia peplus]|nr:cation/H+ exchanger 4 [Euphorbia peplus]